MAVTTTTRLGLTRWSEGTDPLSRAQMDASHAALEANAAMYVQGTAGTRPAFGKPGRFHFATDTKVTSFDTGAAWEEVKPDLSALATDVELAAGLATKANTAHSHAIGELPVATSGTSSATLLVRADDSRLSNARTPVAHSHLIADLPVADDGESNAAELVRSNDSRLSNSRTPVAHTHAIADLPVAAGGEVSATKVVRSDDERLNRVWPGMMVVWPVPRAVPVPTGWVRADGAVVDRVGAYADVFALYGTTWNTGGESGTQFRLPNMTQRVPYGSTGAAGAIPLGSYGGSASRTILEANLPAHSHTMTHTHTINHGHAGSTADSGGSHNHSASTDAAGTHNHSINIGYNEQTAPDWSFSDPGGFGQRAFSTGLNAGTSSAGSHSHTVTVNSGGAHTHTLTIASHNGSSGASSAASTGATGGNVALDTLNPYAAVDWIIKL